MNEPIKDFLGHELNIGDRCVFLKNERTGSSTVRKILHVGEITGIAKSTVTFQDVITLNGKIKVLNGNDIVKLSEPKTEFVPVEVVHGEWVDKYKNKYDNHLYVCSVCGGEALYEHYTNELGQAKSRQVLSPFCPDCSAKMDIRQVDSNGR